MNSNPFRNTASDSERNSAYSIFLEYAQARGIPSEFAVARLPHSSFISRQYRYVYIETPKAACTLLKHFISESENAPLDISKLPYLKETRLPMMIHQRMHVGVPMLIDLKAPELREILSGNSDYFIFALVRNPFSRLVSAFESKVRLREPGFKNVAKRWGATEAGTDIRATFADFVKEAVEPLARTLYEHHFIPQRELLLPDLIPYSRFFQVEQFEMFEQTFFDYLRGRGAAGPLKFEERNRSYYPNWRFYYDEATAERVAEFYKQDFEAFGYDIDSWRLHEAAPALCTTASEAHWRKEIIERNEMIEFLYERLGS